MVTWEGNITSDHKLLDPSGHSRTVAPWLLTFCDMSDAVGCSADATAAQGVTDRGVSGRERSQQDSSPGKAGTPHATPAS